MQSDKSRLRPNDLWPKLDMVDGPQSDLNGTSQGRVNREKAYEMMDVAPPPLGGRATFWKEISQ